MIATNTTALSSLIKVRQTALGITNADLALALGCQDERVVMMIKQGQMSLPINKVSTFAEALSLDPVELLRVVLKDSSPGLLEVVEGILDLASRKAGISAG